MHKMRTEVQDLNRGAARGGILWAQKRILDSYNAFLRNPRYTSEMEHLGNCGVCAATVYNVQKHIWCKGSGWRGFGIFLAAQPAF